ncbi:glycosyltransferase family 25 protein [Martelella limonii]|uniref:glycosyltransferase family 25 protein n=1 Tax=Martelella limonii TaxID=1647649 RepID=UPI001580629E
MHTFVINLDRDTARLARLEALFGDRGLAFTRVAAVDAKTMSAADIAGHCAYPEPVSIRLLPGEVACYLSHIKAWRMLIESGEPHAAIFEDDIDISDDAAGILSAIGGWMTDEADIVKLETSLKPAELGRHVTAPLGDRELRRLAGCHIGAAGYVISRGCAAKMIRESAQLKMAVDTMLFDPRGGIAETLSLFQLSPALCIQTRLQDDDETKIESNIAARADQKSYGTNFTDILVNRVKDRAGYAARRLRNLVNGVRTRMVAFKP